MLRNKPLPGQSAVVCVCVCVGSSDMCGRLGWCSVAVGSAWHYSGCWTNGHLTDSSTGVGQSTEFRSHQITLHFYVAVDIHLSLWTGCKERRNPITGFVVSVPCV